MTVLPSFQSIQVMFDDDEDDVGGRSVGGGSIGVLMSFGPVAAEEQRGQLQQLQQLQQLDHGDGEGDETAGSDSTNMYVRISCVKKKTKCRRYLVISV